MSRGICAGVLIVGTALLCPLPAFPDDDGPYLSRIAVERAAGDETVFATSVRSILHVNDPARAALSFAAIDGLQVVALDDDTISIEFAERPTISGDVDGKFLQSTFVVDFDEEPVQTLTRQLRTNLEHSPSTTELVTFVNEHIDNKTYSRAFDLASRVAVSGEGDCTEHAVLLAALARANGFHARVTFGTIIIDTDIGLYAYGHAWTEIHDGQGWQIGDATRPESEPGFRQLWYLPVGVLDNEGPGYFLSMIDVMSSMPVRITGMANTD